MGAGLRTSELQVRSGPEDKDFIPDNNRDLERYPFLNEASDYIRNAQINFEEFNQPETQYIIDAAIDRINYELSGNVYDKLEKRYKVEVLTFLAALMLVKSIGIPAVLRKFSLFESMRAENFLIKDLRDNQMTKTQKQRLLYNVFEDLFKMKVDIDTQNRHIFKVRFTDYLIRAAHFNEREWKLINRQVDGGYVYLDADETVRLVRNELSALISQRVNSMNASIIPEKIKLKAEDLRTRYSPRYEYRATAVTDYPPCVKHALEVMGKGENLPHSARVMLATYMLSIGKPIDEIVMLYENAPDFNQKITRYQVEHLAGMKGSRTKYSVPSCDKLRNEDLCFATAECDGIINPVQFGRKRK